VEQGAFEARYLTSANRRHFKALDAPSRRVWLQEKLLATRARLEAREREWDSELGVARSELNNSLEDVNGRTNHSRAGFVSARDAWRAAHLYQSRAAEAARRQSAQTLSGVRNLSGVPLVHQQRTTAMPSPDRLKSDTSPAIVLEAAVRLFKIDLAHYGVGSGFDGTPRILHADKQYNLGDFFTKHLGVAWDAARPILTDCYHATLSDGLPPPNGELWKSFSAWRQQAFEDRREAGQRARAMSRARLVQAREEYKRVKINGRSLPVAQRLAAIAAARAAKLVTEAEARQLVQQLPRRPSRNAEYREFLTELANRGNLAALGELRRAAPPDVQPFDGVTGGKGGAVLPLPSYKIDHVGKVTYFKNEQSIVADSAKGVAVLRRDAAAYETALKVAVARYGKNLTLRGDQVFLDSMIAAARRSGLDLVIRDASKPRAQPIVLRAPEVRR